MENKEFKVGDRVIGWHHTEAKYSKEPWVIGEIHNGRFIYPENGPNNWNTGIEDIKHYPESKKIIGYKLRDKAYEYAALVLLGQKDYLTFKEYAGAYPLPEPMCFKENCDFSRALEEAGVLDLWFSPIYKEDKFSDFSHSEHGITLYKGVSLADKFIKSPEFSCVTSFQMKVNGVKHNFSKADVELIKEYVKTLG